MKYCQDPFQEECKVKWQLRSRISSWCTSHHFNLQQSPLTTRTNTASTGVQ